MTGRAGRTGCWIKLGRYPWTEREVAELVGVKRYGRANWKTNDILRHRSRSAIISKRAALRKKNVSGGDSCSTTEVQQ